jgi:hypothetical protein
VPDDGNVIGERKSRAASLTAKATEGVKNLEGSPDELPGVEGVERSEGNGGNWGSLTRPGGLRRSLRIGEHL